MKVCDILKTYRFIPVVKVVIWRGCKLLVKYQNIQKSMEEALRDYGDEDVVTFNVDTEGQYMYIKIRNN